MKAFDICSFEINFKAEQITISCFFVLLELIVEFVEYCDHICMLFRGSFTFKLILHNVCILTYPNYMEDYPN